MLVLVHPKPLVRLPEPPFVHGGLLCRLVCRSATVSEHRQHLVQGRTADLSIESAGFDGMAPSQDRPTPRFFFPKP